MPDCGNCFSITSISGPCGKAQPGGSSLEFNIVPACWIDSVTRDVLGVVTAITLDTVLYPTATWFKVSAKKDTVLYDEALNVSNNSLQQTFVFTISNYSDNVVLADAAQEQSNWIGSLITTTNGWVLMSKDKLGVRYIHGLDAPLFATVLAKSRGAVGTDVAGSTITLSEAQGESAPAIDAAATFTPATNVI